MAKLQRDRILETCLKRKLSAHLVVGWPVVFGEGPTRREGMVPPITFEEFSSMLQEIMPLENEIQERLGARTFTVRYGSEFRCFFEVRGDPAPTSVTITQLS